MFIFHGWSYVKFRELICSILYKTIFDCTTSTCPCYCCCTKAFQVGTTFQSGSNSLSGVAEIVFQLKTDVNAHNCGMSLTTFEAYSMYFLMQSFLF